MVFSTFIPLVDLIWRRRTGRISDLHVSNREERKWPIIFGIFYTIAGLATFYLLSGPLILQACMLSGLVLGLITLVVTSFWKISLHLMGNASLAVIIYFGFNLRPLSLASLALLLLLAAVGFSRFITKAHTTAQILSGAAAGATITAIVFLLMGTTP